MTNMQHPSIPCRYFTANAALYILISNEKKRNVHVFFFLFLFFLPLARSQTNLITFQNRHNDVHIATAPMLCFCSELQQPPWLSPSNCNPGSSARPHHYAEQSGWEYNGEPRVGETWGEGLARKTSCGGQFGKLHQHVLRAFSLKSIKRILGLALA